MRRATSIADVVSIEGELPEREADLESLEQAELTQPGRHVHGGSAAPPAAAASPRQGGFVGGFDSRWHAFLGALSVVLVVLGAVLPFLVVLGGLAWCGRCADAVLSRPPVAGPATEK